MTEILKNVSEFVAGSGITLQKYRHQLTISRAEYINTDTLNLADITLKSGPWVDVRAFGASCDGVTDDTNAIKSAISDIATEGTILIPGLSKISSNITTGSKVIHFMGLGFNTGFTGNGFTLLTLASHRSTVSKMKIYSDNDDASTIGIDINNGASGVNNWELNKVAIMGTNKSGIGLRTVFGLKGKVSGCDLEGWAKNSSLTASGGSKSNAIYFDGSKIRVGTIGISVEASGIDNLFLVGNTIEGNSIGLSLNAGKTSALGNHFENNLGSQINVDITAANFHSVSNFYSAAAANKDIVVNSGANKVISESDTLNSGVTHNGTGMFYIDTPIITVAKTGTGVITEFDGYNVIGTNFSPYAFSFTGYSAVTTDTDFRAVTAGKGIILKNAAGTITKRVRLNDTGDGLVYEDI